jgi:hypothetical protein
VSAPARYAAELWGVLAAVASGDVDGREMLLADMGEAQLKWSLNALAVTSMELVRSSLVRKGDADPDGSLVVLVREQILREQMEADGAGG